MAQRGFKPSGPPPGFQPSGPPPGFQASSAPPSQAVKPEARPAATGESVSRDLPPGGLAGRLTDEALSTVLEPFSMRTAADAQGKTQWQLPPIVGGVFDVINALGAPATPVRRPGQPIPPTQTPRQQQREAMAAKDTETMKGLAMAPIAPITNALPTTVRGAGALVAPSMVNPPAPEAQVEAARTMPNALTSTIPLATGMSGRLAGEARVLAGDINAARTGAPSPSSQISALNRAIPQPPKEPLLPSMDSIRASAADRLTSSWLKPRMSETDPFNMNAYSYGADPIKAVQQEGIKANTFTGAIKQVRTRIDDLTSQVRQRYSQNPATVDLAETINAEAAEAIKAAKFDGNEALATRIRALADGQIEKIKATHGDTLVSTPDVATIKTELGRTANWATLDALEQGLNSFRKNLYRGYDKILDRIDPASKVTNERIANMITAEKLLERRFQLKESQDISPSTAFGSVKKLLPETATKTRLIQAITPELRQPTPPPGRAKAR